jgi:hypothetical protein
MWDPLQLSNLQSAKWMRENLNRLEETRGKDLIKPYRDLLDKTIINTAMQRTGEPEYLQEIFGKRVAPEAAPTGIQTIPGEKKSFNVMMNEQGNVMDDQSMAELARETGMAPDIQNHPIRSMSDVMRMIGPGESIAEGTAYNQPLTPEMQQMQARGIDPRMARSYQENIQLMGDPRMRPPMPIGVMPPSTGNDPGYFSNPNVSAANPGGYASQDEAIADLGIERYNQLYAKGGRASYTKGGLAKVLGV